MNKLLSEIMTEKELVSYQKGVMDNKIQSIKTQH